MNSDLWVLEWSQKSNGFHVQSMDAMLSKNRQAYRDDHRPINNWLVIHVGTKNECQAVADAARQTIVSRAKRVEVA